MPINVMLCEKIEIWKFRCNCMGEKLTICRKKELEEKNKQRYQQRIISSWRAGV